MKKVWILTALREHESYTSSNDVLGVYKSKESAEKAMNESLDKEIEAFKEEYDELEIKRGSDLCSVYDTLGGIEYTEFSISVRVIQD